MAALAAKLIIVNWCGLASHSFQSDSAPGTLNTFFFRQFASPKIHALSWQHNVATATASKRVLVAEGVGVPGMPLKKYPADCVCSPFRICYQRNVHSLNSPFGELEMSLYWYYLPPRSLFVLNDATAWRGAANAASATRIPHCQVRSQLT